MYCNKCGEQISDIAKFCPSCGAAGPDTVNDVQENVLPVSEPLDLSVVNVPSTDASIQQETFDNVPNVIPESEPFSETTAGKQSRNSSKKIRPTIILAVCMAIVVIAAVFIPVAIGAGKAICYQVAVKLMDAEKYNVAKVTFDVIDSYKDSKVKAIECQNALDYSKATALMASEDYAAAQEIFTKLDAYKDSASLAEECGDRVLYKEAVVLAEAGDYSGAKAKLMLLAALKYEEYDDLLNECNNNVNYTDAVTAFDKGQFYTAYKLFSSLGDFKDSAEKAGHCEQGYPPTGEIYRNSDYAGSAVTLKTQTPKDDARPSLLKIYAVDGTLVLSLFIGGGESPSISFPAGTYMIKTAYGAKWYGPEEMFGDNAVYQTLLLEGSTTYSFKSNNTYTLTLRSVVDGNVDATRESRSNF